MVELQQHRLNRADHEGQRDEEQGHPDTPLGVLQLQIHRAAGAIQCQHHQTRDDSRQREGQVDHRIDQPLAGKIIPGQHPRHEQAEHRIHAGDTNCDGQRHLE